MRNLTARSPLVSNLVPRDFVPLDQRPENESSGNNHSKITMEITEFCPSDFTVQSASMSHAWNVCSQSSRFPNEDSGNQIGSFPDRWSMRTMKERLPNTTEKNECAFSLTTLSCSLSDKSETKCLVQNTLHQTARPRNLSQSPTVHFHANQTAINFLLESA